MRSEITILSNLIHNDEYTKQVLPFLEKDFFDDPGEQKIYEIIHKFVVKYNKPPTKEAVLVELDIQEMSESIHKAASTVMEIIEKSFEKLPDINWLIHMSEAWGQEKKIFNEAKKDGFDTVPLKAVLREEALDKDIRIARNQKIAEYKHHLGIKDLFEEIGEQEENFHTEEDADEEAA